MSNSEEPDAERLRRDLERRLYNRNKVIVVAFFLLLSVIPLFFMYRMSKPVHVRSPEKMNIRFNVHDKIKEGDAKFRDYHYDAALRRYRYAEDEITRLVEFESESPSKNDKLLQHYHNMKMLLRVRIELAITAKEISRVQHEIQKP